MIVDFRTQGPWFNHWVLQHFEPPNNMSPRPHTDRNNFEDSYYVVNTTFPGCSGSAELLPLSKTF
jgi:hypothetical protein